MKYCSQCGAELAGARYCGQCGARTDHTSSTAASESRPGDGPGPGGFEENHLGLLAYLTPVPALALLIIEPYSRNGFVRFHSYQCLLLTLASIVLAALTWTLSFVFLKGLLSNLMHLLLVAGWGWAAYMAWQGQQWQVPIIGELARRKASRID